MLCFVVINNSSEPFTRLDLVVYTILTFQFQGRRCMMVMGGGGGRGANRNV